MSVPVPLRSAGRVALAGALTIAALGGRAPAAAQSGPPSGSPAGTRVAGVVADSLDFGVTPLAGAVVQLVERGNPAADRTTRTDVQGHFALDGVPPGRYLVGFYHPRLDVLGIELRPREVLVPPTGIDGLALATPGRRALRQALCGAAVRDSAGVVVGIVRDADTDTPVAGAMVAFSWNEMTFTDREARRVPRQVAAPTQSGGVFAACGLPTDDDVLVEVRSGNRRSGVLQLTLEPGGLAIQEFALGDTASARLVDAPSDPAAERAVAIRPAAKGRAAAPAAPPRVARGTARLTGVVRREDGSPAPGAEVVVWGTGLRARAGDDGSFTIGDLPAGTFQAEARAVGFLPHRVAVALGSGRAAAATFVLDSRGALLETVTVRGKRSRRGRALDAFLRRRREGYGHFLAAADLAVRASPLLTDALWAVPGVAMQVQPHGERAVRMRGGCRPQVVLDGQVVSDGADAIDRLVRPADVLGVEVYTNTTGIPAEWSGARTNNCGVVAIWTRI